MTLVQDSWLIDAGRVRALPRHLARFAGGVRALRPDERSPSEAELESFLADVPARLPATGRWFPRITCRWKETANGRSSSISPQADRTTPDAVLGLELRPMPEIAIAGTVVLWCASPGDPRTRPSVKGPDLELLGRLRARASDQGADEAVLLDAEGFVLEGAYSSLVWWRAGHDGRPVLHVPAGPVLPSVTRALVEELAAEDGIPVRAQRARPEELVRAEVWCMSALRGLQLVTGWMNADAAPAPPASASPGRRRASSDEARASSDHTASATSPRALRLAWQARLDALARHET